MHRLLTAFVLLVQFPLTAQTLQLTIQPGDAFRSITSSTQEIVQNMGGTETRIHQKSAITIRYTVRNRSETEMVLDMRFEHIRFHQESPMGEQSYDSAQPPENPSPQLKQLARTYKAMLDSSMAIVIDPTTGRQIRMEGWAEFLDQVLDEMEMGNTEVRQKMKEQLEASVQDRMSAAGAYGVLPPVYGQSLKNGTSWSDQQTVKMMSDMTVNTEFTLTEVTDDSVTVRISSSLETPVDAPPVEMGFAQMKYNLNGSQQGTITLDRDSGWATRTSIEHIMDGKLEAEGQGYAIPMSISGTIQTVSEPIEP